jgi:ELWxxDGT repeat protein
MSSRSCILGAAVALGLATPAWPQARLVKDINTTTTLSFDHNLRNMLTIGSTTFFTQFTPALGTELWKTDGTTAGTVLVKDICPGSCEYRLASLTNFAGMLFFSVNNVSTNNYPYELWKSDGTEAGTVRVKTLCTSHCFESSQPLWAVANGLLFLRKGGALWRSDGTEAGTAALANIGTIYTDPVAFGARVFFGANEALWVSGGSPSGTVVVKALLTYPENLTTVDNRLFFTLSTNQLWSSDGTENGTLRVKVLTVDFDFRPSLGNFTSLNDLLIFTLRNAVSGRELWKSDGTDSGTVMVREIRPGSTGAFPLAAEVNYTPVRVGGHLFFPADDGASGIELWMTDGTTGGTVLVKDILAGSSGAFPQNLTSAKGLLFFTADNGRHGVELWRSDGTAAGTTMVKDILPGASSSSPAALAERGGGLLFGASDGMTGRHLWKSDGTENGTTVLFNEGSEALSASSDPIRALTIGSTAYFAANDGFAGAELWKSDGTAAGTVLVEDIRVGPDSSSPRNLASHNGALYFAADDGLNGLELWRSDGTAAGTFMVRNIAAQGGSSSPSQFVSYGRDVFFRVSGGLWRTDGTETGTQLVKACTVGSSEASALAVAQGTVFFACGSELWKTDGTALGTLAIKDLCSGSCSGVEFVLSVRGVIFATANNFSSSTVWRSDGTEAGTQKVADFSFRNNVTNLTDVNGTLFFVRGTSPYELWKSDGTLPGTVRVKQLSNALQTQLGVAVQSLTNVNGTLFFALDDGTRWLELWKSDGTESGTVIVKDIWPGGGASNPQALTVVQDMLYFSANDGVSGRELWRTDGTSAGTVQVQDVCPGSCGDVGMIVKTPQGLLFSQRTRAEGDRELWLLPLDTLRVFRLYSNQTLEHLYTTDAYEDSILPQFGWTREGRAYTLLSSEALYQGATPAAFHRLYNPGSQQHLWTSDSNEASFLGASPHWSYEGVIGYILRSSITGSVPLYRMALANPSLHLWTTDANEYQVLQTRGWIPEGIIGYVLP